MIPPDWNDYLKNDENKAELFGFLANALLRMNTNLEVVTNVCDVVKARGTRSELHDAPCGNMEEADARIIWHARDAVSQGAKRVLIRASDTDILVIALSHFHFLQSLGLQVIH